jgi:glycosyltransferase involved in cell wall biosynthesis
VTALTAVRPLTIGLDVSPLGVTRSGIGRYTYELLDALWKDETGPRVVPVGNRGSDGATLPSDHGETPSIRGPRFPSRAAWTFGLLPCWLRRSGLDIFHGTSFYAPLGSGIPTVVTFHDMSAFVVPHAHPALRVVRARAMLRRVADAASAIITPSEAARQDAVAWLGIHPDRLHVVPGAPAAHFRPVEPATAARVAARYGLEPGFFLALGNVEPRKNLEAAVEAVARLRNAGSPVHLAVAGRLGWKYQPFMDRVTRLGVGGLVRLLGFVPDDDLPGLMSAAASLVYPSLYEGFGLPILEAMACGLPVITTASGATGEVAGAAALLIDPHDPDGIAMAMRSVQEPGARARLGAAGLRRASEFSWERSARETMAVYGAVRARHRAST